MCVHCILGKVLLSFTLHCCGEVQSDRSCPTLRKCWGQKKVISQQNTRTENQNIIIMCHIKTFLKLDKNGKYRKCRKYRKYRYFRTKTSDIYRRYISMIYIGDIYQANPGSNRSATRMSYQRWLQERERQQLQETLQRKEFESSSRSAHTQLQRNIRPVNGTDKQRCLQQYAHILISSLTNSAGRNQTTCTVINYTLLLTVHWVQQPHAQARCYRALFNYVVVINQSIYLANCATT